MKIDIKVAAAVSLGLLWCSVTMLGCKAKEGPASGYLEDTAQESRMTKDEQYPFHRVWFDPSWNSSTMKTLVVRPVNTQYLEEAGWWTKTNLKGGKLEEDTANLALYIQETFLRKFSEDKNQRFAVVDAPQDDSLILEMALVEIVPNKASLGALGLAATVVAAPVGAGIAAKETAKGKVAIEGRWVRASDGKVVAMWADREHGKFGPWNLRRATWYGHAHKIVSEWADQWVKIANAPPDEKIKDTKTFTLRPW